MKTMKLTTLVKKAKEGRLELLTDVSRSGLCEIRWTATGKRETIMTASR